MLFLVISSTVAAAVAGAKLVMMSGIGLSSDTLCTCSFGGISLRTRSLFASSMVMVQLDGEITQGSSCAFSCIHCFAFISRDVAFRLRGLRHEFLVARLLSCRCLDLSPSLRTCRLKYLKKLKNNAFVGYTEHFLFTRSTFLVQRLGRQEVLLVGWSRSAFLADFFSICCLVNGLIVPTFKCFHLFQSVSQALSNTRSTFSGLPKSWCIHASSLKQWAWARACTTLSLNSSSSARKSHSFKALASAPWDEFYLVSRLTGDGSLGGGLGSLFISHAAGILNFPWSPSLRSISLFPQLVQRCHGTRPMACDVRCVFFVAL